MSATHTLRPHRIKKVGSVSVRTGNFNSHAPPRRIDPSQSNLLRAPSPARLNLVPRHPFRNFGRRGASCRRQNYPRGDGERRIHFPRPPVDAIAGRCARRAVGVSAGDFQRRRERSHGCWREAGDSRTRWGASTDDGADAFLEAVRSTPVGAC